jgi:thiamine-phosphate pyrophosphorylase
VSGLDPRLYLVTDPGLVGERDLPGLVEAVVRAGVTLVQLRHKSASTAALLRLALVLVERLRPLGVPLIVNDRADVALAAGAAGVHVGQSDLPAPLARRVTGGRMLVGLSIEHLPEMGDAGVEAADYLAASPVFGTATKADIAPPLGLDGLARMRGMTKKPIVAIGGIDLERAAQAILHGADGVAVVRAILGADDPVQATRALRHAIDASLARRRKLR